MLVMLSFVLFIVEEMFGKDARVRDLNPGRDTGVTGVGRPTMFSLFKESGRR